MMGLKRHTKQSTDAPQESNRNQYLFGLSKKKIIGTVISLCAVVIIVWVIVIPLFQGSLRFLIVLSGSMEPSIRPGDVVVSVQDDPSNLNVGDIISFQKVETSKKTLITHRIVNITDENGTRYYQTKGDANDHADQLLTPQQNVVGKVVITIPYLGYLPHFVKTPLGFILIIVIPGSLIILSESVSIYKSTRK
jgi:signal peptidase